MKKAWMFALVGVVGLAGCAQTRDPHVVSMTKSTDASLSCQAIETEYKANTEVAEYKISKNNSDDGRDILIGFFIWPGLADFKNADGIEGNALLDRNVYLRKIAIDKECDVTDWPTQPTRYT